MSTQSKSVLEIKDLHVAIETPDGSEKEILKGVDLTVRSGEIHAVMGPNGSGKTVFIKQVGPQTANPALIIIIIIIIIIIVVYP